MPITKKPINQDFTADGDTTDTLSIDGAGTVACEGSFGGGTVTFPISYDGGVSFPFTLKDITGVQVAMTADDALDFVTQTPILIKANLNGSTTPVLNIKILP